MTSKRVIQVGLLVAFALTVLIFFFPEPVTKEAKEANKMHVKTEVYLGYLGLLGILIGSNKWGKKNKASIEAATEAVKAITNGSGGNKNAQIDILNEAKNIIGMFGKWLK